MATKPAVTTNKDRRPTDMSLGEGERVSGGSSAKRERERERPQHALGCCLASGERAAEQGVALKCALAHSGHRHCSLSVDAGAVLAGAASRCNYDQAISSYD